MSKKGVYVNTRVDDFDLWKDDDPGLKASAKDAAGSPKGSKGGASTSPKGAAVDDDDNVRMSPAKSSGSKDGREGKGFARDNEDGPSGFRAESKGSRRDEDEERNGKLRSNIDSDFRPKNESVDSPSRSRTVTSFSVDDEFSVGTAVESRYGGVAGGRFMAGRITRVLGDGLYDIEYTNGEMERRVRASMIRLRSLSSTNVRPSAASSSLSSSSLSRTLGPPVSSSGFSSRDFPSRPGGTPGGTGGRSLRAGGRFNEV